MSGPKCASYSIENAELERARQHQAALDASDRLQRRRATLGARAEAEGFAAGDLDALPDPPTAGTTSEIQGWNAATEQALRQTTAVFDAHLAEKARERARALLADIGDELAAELQRELEAELSTQSGQRTTKRPAAAPQATSPSTTDRAARLQRLVSMVPAGATDAEAASITEALRNTAEADDAVVVAFARTAEMAIRAVADNVARRAAHRTEALELLARFDGHRGAAVDAARRILERAAEGGTELLDTDRRQFAAVLGAAEREAERRYVAEALEAALAEVGYDVGADFDTALTASGEIYAAKPDATDHAIGVRLRDGEVDLRVVRATPTSDTRADTAAEIDFCRDVNALGGALASNGVALSIVANAKPGTVPVAVVSEAGDALRSVSRRTEHSKEREHP